MTTAVTKQESRGWRCWNHFWRLKTALLVLFISGWYVATFEPKNPGDETRLWIAANTIWKVTLGVVMVHVGRHEMFPYMRFGLVIKDYREAMKEGDGPRAQAAAALAFGYCVLIGLLFMTVVGVVAKW